MRLTRFGYQELVGKAGEWSLEPFVLQQTNLIVGRNSVGKSRTLNTIGALARLLQSGEGVNEGKFDADFEHVGQKWSYKLVIEDSEVRNERLVRDEKVLIDRLKGEIWSEFDNRQTRFKMRDNQIAANAKLDLLQTPYLQLLNQWANSVFHFHFGSTLGQLTVALPHQTSASTPEINVKDENETAKIYRYAFETYGEAFGDAIISDMRAIGYDVKRVDMGYLPNLRPVNNPHAAPFRGLLIEENGLRQVVEQTSMSTGMFRALAIIIHVNLAVFSNHAELILLDDIGEGLDFERSTALIKIITQKIVNTNAQIIMTSNDRFIMNAVDTDCWTVLSRTGSNVRAFNKTNNPNAFEEFKFSGLQNFDFFSMDLATETDHPA